MLWAYVLRWLQGVVEPDARCCDGLSGNARHGGTRGELIGVGVLAVIDVVLFALAPAKPAPMNQVAWCCDEDMDQCRRAGRGYERYDAEFELTVRCRSVVGRCMGDLASSKFRGLTNSEVRRSCPRSFPS